jgi:hypothetical protein
VAASDEPDLESPEDVEMATDGGPATTGDDDVEPVSKADDGKKKRKVVIEVCLRNSPSNNQLYLSNVTLRIAKKMVLSLRPSRPHAHRRSARAAIPMCAVTISYHQRLLAEPHVCQANEASGKPSSKRRKNVSKAAVESDEDDNTSAVPAGPSRTPAASNKAAAKADEEEEKAARSESEMSVLIDATPVKKKGKKRKAETDDEDEGKGPAKAKGKQKASKAKDGEKKERKPRAKKGAKEVDKDEEMIKRLKVRAYSSSALGSLADLLVVVRAMLLHVAYAKYG